MNNIPPEERVRIYQAGSGSRNVVTSLAMAGRELYSCRYIMWRVFTRDFTAQFRQRVLGYFWAVLTPLLSVVSFVFMNLTGILHPGAIDMPYPVYVFFGNGLWGVLIGSLTTVSGGLLSNSELLVRTGIPKLALALTGVGNMLYAILVQLVLLGVLMAVFRVVPAWGMLLYPLMVLPLMMMGVGMGLILAIIGIVARDATNVVTTLLGLVMYITPVLFVTKFDSPVLQQVVKYNPLTYIFNMSRSMAFEGRYDQWGTFAVVLILAVGILVLGIHGFYLIMDKVAERL